MLLNDIFKVDDLSEIKLKRKTTRVIASNGNVLCGVSKKYIYNLSGNKVAELVSKEKVNEEKIYIYEGTINDETFQLVLKQGCLFYQNEIVGKLLYRIKSRPKALLWLSICLTAVMIAVIALLQFTPKPEEVFPNFNIYDDNGEWGVEGEIEVFNKGEKLSPGGSGEYNFVINNPHDVILNYVISISFEYNGEVTAFPLTYSLKMNNVGIEWSEQTKEKYVVKDLMFASQSSQMFTLVWEWPFESGNDAADTEFGQNGGQYTMCISIDATTA